ncbi:unnamed protein product [Vitrella brassicaformis CCMP3155]|uniref:Uncharacterized protein n=1 Tax=Vitrella brassicaformis (strain CCMP3155) TaxID=1169540 RepID=A0A0G4F4D3_VITBC|nr:unnamed protein product [Vitrella brassicaformis CCMP3155]|eukprot:CEM06599.1 unnamed protein product [Vitrella brassicaformis CCMP3155]
MMPLADTDAAHDVTAPSPAPQKHPSGDDKASQSKAAKKRRASKDKKKLRKISMMSEASTKDDSSPEIKPDATPTGRFGDGLQSLDAVHVPPADDPVEKVTNCTSYGPPPVVTPEMEPFEAFFRTTEATVGLGGTCIDESTLIYVTHIACGGHVVIGWVLSGPHTRKLEAFSNLPGDGLEMVNLCPSPPSPLEPAEYAKYRSLGYLPVMIGSADTHEWRETRLLPCPHVGVAEVRMKYGDALLESILNGAAAKAVYQD